MAAQRDGDDGAAQGYGDLPPEAREWNNRVILNFWWDQQVRRAAVCMCKHVRLGEGSSLASLDEGVLRMVLDNPVQCDHALWEQYTAISYREGGEDDTTSATSASEDRANGLWWCCFVMCCPLVLLLWILDTSLDFVHGCWHGSRWSELDMADHEMMTDDEWEEEEAAQEEQEAEWALHGKHNFA